MCTRLIEGVCESVYLSTFSRFRLRSELFIGSFQQLDPAFSSRQHLPCASDVPHYPVHSRDLYLFRINIMIKWWPGRYWMSSGCAFYGNIGCWTAGSKWHDFAFKQCKINTDSIPLNSRTTEMRTYQGPINHLLSFYHPLIMLVK